MQFYHSLLPKFEHAKIRNEFRLIPALNVVDKKIIWNKRANGHMQCECPFRMLLACYNFHDIVEFQTLCVYYNFNCVFVLDAFSASGEPLLNEQFSFIKQRHDNNSLFEQPNNGNEIRN